MAIYLGVSKQSSIKKKPGLEGGGTNVREGQGMPKIGIVEENC
jgi:hypothetical protein